MQLCCERIFVKNRGVFYVNCRVCGSSNTTFLCETHNEHGAVAILTHYRCSTCGSVFVGNNINREELVEAYATLDSKEYYAEIENENRRKMLAAVDRLKELIPESASIIDIGAGSGLFVKKLYDAGFGDVSAHEIPGEDLSNIKNMARGIYQDFDYRSIPPDTFDAVVLLDVVEHVTEPKYLIETCSTILKSNGVIYFHTPVVTRVDRLMHSVQKLPMIGKIGKIWQRGRTSIFHLENYTPKSIMCLLEQAGFGNIVLEVRNELSWPVKRYIKTYLLEKHGIPNCFAPLLYPVLYPLLATDLFNANKAIVSATKAR